MGRVRISKSRKCPICNASFMNIIQIRNHIKTKHRAHKTDHFHCSYCTKDFTFTNERRILHIDRHQKSALLKTNFALTKQFTGDSDDDSEDRGGETYPLSKEFKKVYKDSSLSYPPMGRTSFKEIQRLIQAESLNTGSVKVKLVFTFHWADDSEENIKSSTHALKIFEWGSGKLGLKNKIQKLLTLIEAMIMEPELEYGGSGYTYLGRIEKSPNY